MNETPLIKIEDNVFLKMENLSESKSHKYRLAEKHIINAINLGYKKVTVGTCGNYGYSIFLLSKKFDIQTKIFITKNSYLKINDKNIEYCDSYEDCVTESVIFSKKNKNYYDANCFGKHENISLTSYYDLARSIDVFPNMCLWIPVGNGITLTSIYRYFKSINKNIHYGIVGSENNSSPIKSMIKKSIVSIKKNEINISKLNQPLVNYEPVPNTNELIEIGKHNTICEVSDEEILRANVILKKYKIKTEEYGCAAYAGFNKIKNKKINNVIIITA